MVNDADGPVAKAVVDEISAAGGQAVASHDSVATPAGGAAIIDQALDAFGQLDILVNNAGILRDKSFANLPPRWSTRCSTCTCGARSTADPGVGAHGAAQLRPDRHHHSASGLFGNFGQANYGAAKAALVGLTRVLAVEGRKIGINVNAVAPAAATRMNARLLGVRAALLSPDAIAPVVAFLAHRDCELSGQILSVGGGHVSTILVSVTRGIADRS